MTLQELFDSINGQTNVHLTQVFPVDHQLGIYYKSLGAGGDFIVTNAKVSKTEEGGSLVSVKLIGTASLAQVGKPSDIKIIFTEDTTEIAADNTFGNIGEALNFTGVQWFNMGKIALETKVSNGPSPVQGSIIGELSAIPDLEFSLVLPVENDKLQIKGDFSEPESLNKFFKLVGGINLVAALPAPFNGLAALGVTEVDMLYDIKAKSLSHLSIVVQTPKGYSWHLLPKLEVDELSIIFTIEEPGNREKRKVQAEIYGQFSIGKQPPLPAQPTNLLQVQAQVPDFNAKLGLVGGQVQLGDLLTVFLPGQSVNLHGAIDKLDISVNPASKAYSLTCDILTDWEIISFSKTSKLTLTNLNFDVQSNNGKASGKIGGALHIGSKAPKGVDLTVFASHPETGGWDVGGKTGAGQQIDLLSLIKQFLEPLGIKSLPSFVGDELTVSDISFLAKLPPESNANGSDVEKGNTSNSKNALVVVDIEPAKKSFQVGGKIHWVLILGSFHFTEDAVIDLTFTESEKPEGSVSFHTQLRSLNFIISYQFKKDNTDLSIKWIVKEGETIDVDYKTKKVGTNVIDTLTIVLKNVSLGDIITVLMQAIIPSFELEAPWSVLNDISLDGFSLVYTRNKDKPEEYTIVLDINKELDLIFLDITDIKLTKDKVGVHLGFEGKFLGIPITAGNENTGDLAGKGSQVDDMPAVPGKGNSAFDLKYLGMGQHVALYPVTNIKSVEEAITDLETVFLPPEKPKNPTDKPIIPIGPKPSKAPPASKPVLVFDENSNWLIATSFTVAKVIDMGIVFNDPNLYGLVIEVAKDAKSFGGLKFEILYKKVTDTIGVYQMELKLPDLYRHFEFGEVSITLPIIGVDIYTNGNFKIDFGFPASITDFSRSFQVQAFPFTGAGGFYFGYLSGATSDRVPKTTKGNFNPVIAIGIGLQLGVGKDINEGILKAGLSVTVVGIIEGVFAKYNALPNPNIKTGKELWPGDGDTYFWVQGTFGIVGKLYGEINFAIISARLDITVYVYIQATIESYHAIPIYLEAGVSVSLRVSINLGLFSIHINLSFHTTVKAHFTIGHDELEKAPWYDSPALAGSTKLMELSSLPDPKIVWQPIEYDNGDKPTINLKFISHLTVAGSQADPVAKNVAMIYVDIPDTSGSSSMNNLCQGLLEWCISALINADASSVGWSDLQQQPVTLANLNTLFDYFDTREDNISPFNYSNAAEYDLVHFLKDYFKVTLSAVDENQSGSMNAAVFPMIPTLKLISMLNSTQETNTDFWTNSMIGTGNPGYLADIQKILNELTVNSQSDLTGNHYGDAKRSALVDDDYEDIKDLSFATFVFRDYMSLICKNMLQHAIDTMDAQGKSSLSVKNLVAGAVTNANVQNASGVTTRFMLHGLRLPVPPTADPKHILPMYEIIGQQVAVPPALTDKDDYVLELMMSDKAGKENTGVPENWFSFSPATSSLPVTLGSTEITRIIDTRNVVGTGKFSPSLEAGYPRPLKMYDERPKAFSFKNDIEWKYPGKFFPANTAGNPPSIWKLPQDMLNVVQADPTQDYKFVLQKMTRKGQTATIKEPVTYSQWSTLVELSVRKIPAQNGAPIFANSYDVIGAGDTDIVYLERLLAYLDQNSDDIIEQVQFLYSADKLETNVSSLLSETNGTYEAGLVQTNLSTETNPALFFTAHLVGDEENTDRKNILNESKDFVRLLWKASTIRSGGYYLYYNTKDNKGLPDNLFNENDTASIYALISFKSFPGSDFVNTVIVGDEIDGKKTTLFAQSDKAIARAATVAPGNIGFEILRDNPGSYAPATKGATPAEKLSENNIYLNNQYNLVGFQIDGITQSVNYVPVGPSKDLDENEIDQVKKGSFQIDTTEDWVYSTVLPYAKLKAPTTKPPAGLPNPDNNPYLVIGETASIALNWQDMFGNTLPTTQSPVQVPALYTDPIMGLSQWPSMTSDYTFNSAGGDTELEVNLRFDTGRFEIPNYNKLNPMQQSEARQDRKKKAQLALQAYTQLYYQLSQSNDLSIFIQSTIDGTKDQAEGSKRPVNVSELQALVGTIYGYLDTVIKQDGLAPAQSGIKIPYSIINPVPPSSVATYSDIFLLSVSMTIERTQFVDPDFANSKGVDGVASAMTAISPLATNNADVHLSLKNFASEFELSFKDHPYKGILLKIAAGVTKDEIGFQSEKKLWIVRFDQTGKAGVRFEYDNSNQFFFAPIPLANSLENLTGVDIYKYATGSTYPAQNTPTKMNFTGIDLDGWGKTFLQAVDDFLSPAFAVPAFIVDDTDQKDSSFLSILKAKEDLAEAIEGTVDYIISPATKAKTLANLGNAQEKFKQQLLNKLSNAYTIDSVCQVPVSINSRWGGSNDEPSKAPYAPKLFGKLQGTPDIPDITGNITGKKQSDEYTLSTAKIGLANGASWLTYYFDAKETAEHSNFPFKGMKYAINHIEHQIEPVDNISDYVASSWLTFVLPLDEKSGLVPDIGGITIPIPLRSYPTPPSITSQLAHYDPKPVGTNPLTIANARKWDFDFSYRTSVADQDSIDIEVDFNIADESKIKTSNNQLLNGDTANLPIRLAQFISVYPAIQKDFVKYLSQINIASKASDTEFKNAEFAIKAFATLINNVADAWKSWNQINPRKPLKTKGSPPELLLPDQKLVKLEIDELDEDGNLQIQVKMDADSTGSGKIPLVDIEGYKRDIAAQTQTTTVYAYSKDGAPLKFDQRNAEPLRKVTLANEDIISLQNVWSSASISRNKDLVPGPGQTWLPTNPKFIYQTALVRFYNRLNPLLVNTKDIDIAKIKSGTKVAANLPLVDHLQNLFDALIADSKLTELFFKIEAEYQYTLKSNGLAITLPVLLTTEKSFKTDGTGTIDLTGLSKALEKWFNVAKPSSSAQQFTYGGEFQFNLTIFSNFDTNIPMIELPLFLSLTNIVGLD